MAGVRAISEDVWARARALYLSGCTHRDIYDRLRMEYKKRRLPTLNAIQKRSHKERWKEAADIDPIATHVERATKEEFAAQGMPESQVVTHVIQGIRAGETLVDDMCARLRKDDKLQAADVLQFYGRLNTNLMISHRFIETYFKATGKYAQAAAVAADTSPQQAQDAEYHRRYNERRKMVLRLYHGDNNGTDG